MRYLLRNLCCLLASLCLLQCGGPLSLVPYALSAGFAMQAEKDAGAQLEYKAYHSKCYPIDPKKDPIVVGWQAEQIHDLTKAYEFYLVAHKLGFPSAKARLDALHHHMQPMQIERAVKNFNKYSKANLSTCFYRPNQLHY